MNLLNYTSIPMKYEVQTTPASLKASDKQPLRADISRAPGGFRMESQQARVQLDTFERRSSMNLKGMPDFMSDAAQRGRSAGMEATRAYAEIGNQIINAHKGGNIPDAMFSQYMQHSQANLVMMPLSSTDISWMPGGVDMNYSPVDLNFDWKMGSQQMQFIPGAINVNITQYPSIKFEYLGGPIYAPPSADPNYQEKA